MGIPTLISTATADDDSEIEFTSGIDSTYDEYMFVFTDINQSLDGYHLRFQVNASGQSGFNEVMTTTVFTAKHDEGDTTTALAYETALDQAQGTGYQPIARTLGNGADESAAGILHLFSPSNTTYVKHFYSRFSNYNSSNYVYDTHTAGYINVTAAITEIKFGPNTGNLDGVIQMYGIA